MSAFDMRNWLARARRSKLSTRVIVLFVAAFILPWSAYAWLTVTERTEQVERTKHTLAVLAAAYGEHATTLMRLGIAVPTDEAVSKPGLSISMGRGKDEMSAFRDALNAPGVNFSLRRMEQPSAALSGVSGPDAVSDLAPNSHQSAVERGEIHARRRPHPCVERKKERRPGHNSQRYRDRNGI
jgi:hypothetical protein